MPTAEELDKVSFEFFKLFARFESTLKKPRFFNKREDQIVVNWDRFANEEVGAGFLNELGDDAPAAKYILDQPPKRQGVNEKNEIVWVEVSPDDKSVQALFSHIRRMEITFTTALSSMTRGPIRSGASICSRKA